jgi:hypothetical protein
MEVYAQKFMIVLTHQFWMPIFYSHVLLYGRAGCSLSLTTLIPQTVATALRDADPACLPGTLKPYDGQAWSAVFQITYARVARAWAAEPVVSREQARELQKEAENTLRMGLNELEAAHAKWREAQDKGERSGLTNLFQNYPFQPILETARRLAAETPR